MLTLIDGLTNVAKYCMYNFMYYTSKNAVLIYTLRLHNLMPFLSSNLTMKWDGKLV